MWASFQPYGMILFINRVPNEHMYQKTSKILLKEAIKICQDLWLTVKLSFPLSRLTPFLERGAVNSEEDEPKAKRETCLKPSLPWSLHHSQYLTTGLQHAKSYALRIGNFNCL